MGITLVLGHFGHGRFGHGHFGQDISAMGISAKDISAMDVSAKEKNYIYIFLLYRGIRPLSVHGPSSTFSNDFFSEAAGLILLIFHI